MVVHALVARSRPVVVVQRVRVRKDRQVVGKAGAVGDVARDRAGHVGLDGRNLPGVVAPQPDLANAPGLDHALDVEAIQDAHVVWVQLPIFWLLIGALQQIVQK